MEPRLFLVYEKNNSLHLHLGGNFDHIELQQNLNETSDFIKAKHSKKMLVDFTKLKFIDQIDFKWMRDSWLPTIKSAGLRYLTFVIPSEFIKSFSADSGLTPDSELKLKWVEDAEAGISWLSNVS